MQIHYKNRTTELILIGVNVLTAAAVVSTFVVLAGFARPLLPRQTIYAVQVLALGIFVAEKIIRFFNAALKKQFWYANWFELLFLAGLLTAVLGASGWADKTEPAKIRHAAIAVYLILQVIIKASRTSINMAASGRNPTRTLILSFLVLIFTGAGLLMLPKASTAQPAGFVDSLFTATSATCVTGLIVKDTGGDFSIMGQVIILLLIQLGGLGIVVFGAVFALLLGQAFSVRESVAMQDLLSARTLNRITTMIAFILGGTIVIEASGALAMLKMYDGLGGLHQQWFYSVFHSISAFCNAGFSLFEDSFTGYNKIWPVYGVICPLIILGGLGFGVLYDIVNITADRLKRLFKMLFSRHCRFSMEAPKRMQLQTKIVLTVSAILIVTGMLAVVVFEKYSVENPSGSVGITDAFFQSVTARTAGFNTVDISSLSAPSKFVLALLMFIGGSPGSAAGGIKTVTLAVLVMAVIAALRKRWEVEIFKRSVRIAVVGRAITVTSLFVAVLFTAVMALSITERSNNFAMPDVIFETASALGTVGLTTGITPSLTAAGKLIIIMVMLVGRLGPLTLLAALTFNLKPARYNYPEEAVIVG